MSRWRATIDARIAERIRLEAGPMPTPCHVWQGPTSGTTGRGKNYPRMTICDQTVAVHRVVYVNRHGYLPSKKQIDHVCRNRLCVNPDHLEMVSHKENQKRRDRAK